MIGPALRQKLSYALAFWNQDHPERPVAWEWVEEMALGWIVYLTAQVSGNTMMAEEGLRRYDEFRRLLPKKLAQLVSDQLPR